MAKLMDFGPVVNPPAKEKMTHIEGALLVLVETQRVLSEIVWCHQHSDYGALIDVDPTKAGNAADATSPRLAMALKCATALMSKLK